MKAQHSKKNYFIYFFYRASFTCVLSLRSIHASFLLTTLRWALNTEDKPIVLSSECPLLLISLLMISSHFLKTKVLLFNEVFFFPSQTPSTYLPVYPQTTCFLPIRWKSYLHFEDHLLLHLCYGSHLLWSLTDPLCLLSTGSFSLAYILMLVALI